MYTEQDGLPFAGDPRNVLKRVMVECQKMGYKFNVGPECEFFLFHTDEEGRPTTVSHEKAGYFDVAPLDLGESARRDMILNLEDMGFEIRHLIMKLHQHSMRSTLSMTMP